MAQLLQTKVYIYRERERPKKINYIEVTSEQKEDYAFKCFRKRMDR